MRSVTALTIAVSRSCLFLSAIRTLCSRRTQTDGSFLQYFFLVGYLRLICWADPTSHFFQPQRAHVPTYSSHRIVQAESYAESVGAEQKVKTRPAKPPELCIGVPSIQRNGLSYLKSTLGSMQHGLDAEEREKLHFVVLIAHTNPFEHPDYHQP